jgi:hypothetical protein
MTSNANVWTSAMWQSSSDIIQCQCDVSESVSSLDHSCVLRRIDRNFLKTAEVNHKATVASSKPVGNVAMLIFVSELGHIRLKYETLTPPLRATTCRLCVDPILTISDTSFGDLGNVIAAGWNENRKLSAKIC